MSNPWAAKCRQLDVYRWQLLRERHGVLSSFLRFARDALSDWWFGVRAKSRLAELVTAQPCDFLLLQSANKVIKLQRKKLLINELRTRGHSLVETALQEPNIIYHIKTQGSDVPHHLEVSLLDYHVRLPIPLKEYEDTPKDLLPDPEMVLAADATGHTPHDEECLWEELLSDPAYEVDGNEVRKCSIT